ncbi:MAG: acyltransferase [Acidobacteriia bacterium]|nr:acyltransferase [Terriglobia bacterium]
MSQPAARRARARFYRPELDGLRFFAFFCVLLRHGAPIPTFAGPLIQQCGSFGLSLFFFLSAFLITELLIRERENTGTVHLKAFYIRRILRIWPLYYVAVALAVIVGRIWPDPFWIGKFRLFSMLFFFMNWVPQIMYGPFTPLWSISVEEQFYAIWPAVASRGIRMLKIASFVLIADSIATLAIGAPRHYRHL